MLLKQPPLSIEQVIGVVFMFFDIIEPKMEGLFGMVGMLLLAIMFIFIPVCFLIVNWEQLKSCFQKNNR